MKKEPTPLPNVNELEKEVLALLAGTTRTDGEMCVGFKYLSDEGTDIKTVRRACRSLRRKGLAEYYRGLMTEDGEVAGSGYCITDLGHEVVEVLEL